MIVIVEQRAGETYLWCKDSIPSARPIKRCEAPRAPSKVRCAPICLVARLPVREKRGVCPGAPKKVWSKMPVFADETIPFPRIDAFADAKTSSNDVAPLVVHVEVREKKSCLRRPDAEPRHLRVTWGVNEERLFNSVPSEKAATTSSAPEKELDSLIVSSSSSSNAEVSPSHALEYVNGSAESGIDALLALADCAVAALEAMEVEIVLVRVAPPQGELAVVAHRRPRRHNVYDPIAHAARLATLRPRADPSARGLIMRSLSLSIARSPQSHSHLSY